jgi:hypothetical protein
MYITTTATIIIDCCRYSQLVILLSDASQDKLDFPNEDIRRFFMEIETNISRSVAWVEQVKKLHFDASTQTYDNLVKLREEAQLISQYLVLPESAVSNFNIALKVHADALRS